MSPLHRPAASTLLSKAASDIKPSGVFATSVPRKGQKTAAAALVSGTQVLTSIWLEAGQIVTTIAFYSSTTAANGPTNQWFSLYSGALARLGVTSDDTNAAWTANTRKALNLASPYTVASTGMYYLGIMVAVSTATPTIIGASSSVQVTSPAPMLVGRDSTNTGLTDPASAPVTATLATTFANELYAEVS